VEALTGAVILGTVIFAARGELHSLVDVPAKPAPAPPAPGGHLAVLQQFFDRHNGLKLTINGDHVNPSGAQCVNLVNVWCQWIGIELFPGDAGDFEYDFHPDCEWIPNTPTNFPYPGDFPVWAKSRALPAGHVGVALWADKDQLHSFDQNWPLGSACHEQVHNYVGVAGWMHPRKLPRPPLVPAW
jgi:hypothetical protein